MREIHCSTQKVGVDLDLGSKKNALCSGLPLHLAIVMSLMGLALLVTASSYAGGPSKAPTYKPSVAPGGSEPLEPPLAEPEKPRSRFEPEPGYTTVEEAPAPQPKSKRPRYQPPRKNPCELDCSYCESLCDSVCGDCGGNSGGCGNQGGGCGNTPAQDSCNGKSGKSGKFGSGSEFFNFAMYPFGRFEKRTSGAEGHLALRLDTTQLGSYTGESDTGRAGIEAGGRVDKKVASVVIIQGDARAHWVGGNPSYTTLLSGDEVLNNERGAKGEVLVAFTLLNPENTCNIYLGALARLNVVNDVTRDKLYATKDVGGEGGLKCDFADGAVKFLIGINGAVSFGDQLYSQPDLEKKLGMRWYLDFLDRLRISGRTEYRYRSQVSDSEFSAEFRNVGPGFYFRYSVEWQSAQQLGAGTAVSAGPGTPEPVVHGVNQVIVGFGF